MGLGVGLAGGLIGDVVAGNSAHGSARSVAGGAISGAASGMGLGAMIGSFVPVIGTGIGAALGAAIGAIYGAISSGLDVKKIAGKFADVAKEVAKATGGIFADIGHGIATAWDNSVGKLVSTVKGWWDDIVRGARWLGDQLVFHSIIPDIVNEITRWFHKLTAPITRVIDFFRKDIPAGAQALKDWFNQNWPAVEGIVTTPIRKAREAIDGIWGQVRRGFSAVLSWVTAPASWNWGRILDTIESPFRSALSWITGKSTGFGALRNAFSSIKDWVTGTWKREWAALERIFTDPVGAARDAIAGGGRALGGILGGLKSRFGSFVSDAGNVLNGLRGVWAAPIRFVVDTVINKGLLGAFNFLAGKLPGLDKINPINLPDSLYPRSTAHPGGYARGGVLPGYTPGRDPHRFYSPTAGTLDLSGGEAILRPEVTRAVGSAWVHAVNAVASSRGVQGVQRYLGGFATGGIFGAVKGAASTAWDTAKNAAGAATDALGDAGAALAGIISDPIGWFKKKIKGAMGDLDQFRQSFIGQAATAVPRAAADAIIGKISDVFGGLFGGGAAGQAGWPVGHAPLGPGFGAGGGRWGATGGRHTGQDFSVPTGTAVHPAWAGIVQLVKSLGNRSYGNYIELSHGGSLHTLYAHLSKMLVKVGDKVTPDSVIGLSGATGNASGPHLHFEVRTGMGAGTPVDPMPYLRGQIGGAAKGAVGSGVQRWAGVVAQALTMLGQPQALAGAVLRRMQFESSGNPTIVNTTDSNWQAGHPSVGLMQVIDSTFRAYAGTLKGVGPFLYGVSTNPLANIYAGLAYALSRYGSISAIDPVNRPQGYDVGGLLRPGLTPAYNLTGRNEAILTDDHAGRLLSLVGRLPATQARGGADDALLAELRRLSGTHIEVHPAPGMDETVLARRTAYELEWARR
jgi:murein DD-endopeptidase MepM/ murein hydrolase activator NlpD/SLT domain-containing protein